MQELDPATGQIRAVAPGRFVFPSGDGRHLFISETDTRLIELPAGGAGRSRALTLPHGWYMPGGGWSLGVAGGVLVQSGRTWSDWSICAPQWDIR
ncbi:MAG TPA: hypothetical protein VGY50_16650, partial [Streptosporangiaceae bacterium]|nr:hypothetical protein [Streptosporangiaceae bacterium]